METKLKELAALCGKGDTDAMLELSIYLKARANPDKRDIYYKGSNMWLLRAAMYGNKTAQEQVLKIMNAKNFEDVVFLRNTVISYEYFIPGKRGSWYMGYSGRNLNSIGLLTFDPNERYTLSGVDEDHHIHAGELISYDEPDETGFGYEEYYRYFYLDEFFQPLRPVSVNGQSRIQTPSSDVLSRELWTDFLHAHR